MEAQIENPYGHLTTLEMMRKVEDKDAEARQLQCNLDTKSDMWQREKEMLLSQFEQLQMRNKEICLLHKDRLELELKNVKQKCDELCRCRKERDQARKETEELQTKLQEYETRIYRYRKERDQARKETKDLQAKLPECETRINRYCKERDQARKLREDLQAKLLECETRINRYREERDQARKLTEDLQAKLLERETRINHYREERDQARKQTEDLQAKLLLRETRTNRYREERDQAQKQTEDLQAKLQEYETRMCEEHDQAQNQTEELQAKLQQHETEMYHYREERDQARKQTEDLQAKLLLRETRTNRYREERDQAQKQTEELQAKLQEYKTRICLYREEHDRVQKQTEKIQAKLQEYETRMCLYHEEHTEATASARSISLDEQVNTLQSQAQAAAIIDCSDSDRLYSAVPSAHSEKCGLLHARDKPGGQLSGTNEFKTVVRTRRGLVQMWMQKPTTPLNHKHKPQVRVKQSDEHYYETGRLMYTGQLSGKEIAGIQLDCHRGHTSGNHNDGSNYLGKQYFICPAGYALYLPLSMVYVEAGSMKCQVPIASASNFQLQYLTNCTAHARGQSNIPAVFPKPTVSTQQTVQPGRLFGSAQQQSLQPTQVKLNATGAAESGPSNSTPFLGFSKPTQSAFRSISLSLSPNSGREEGRMGRADQLGAPMQKNSGSQLQSTFSYRNSSLGSGLVGTQAASSTTAFNFNTRGGMNFDFSAGVGGESGNIFFFTAGSNFDSDRVRVVLRPSGV